ncbi:RagB/SusD family nutrient uptake outer membrane protein [Robertkochia solimangrovi]|uniref:RagB/SusD family nutrient uptake outer membrane protein n=1 Tax=Robertkochia solimangrovi TaxID=2213046 RepID=UPI00117DF876|nr:RagB/SusD family nutrient uptake outer membrane protein [Robertkochia solimangrovi]TRZ41861.1 RagB/SusD family nutrient uptake outer membrane protein [Robertkochia solimangrovi]
MKNIITSLLAALVLVSCDIDRFPYDSIASEELFGGEGGLESATLGNYSMLKGDADGNGFAPQMHRFGEYAGDNVALSGTTTDPLFYIYNYHNITTSGKANNLWTAGYQTIVGCNKIIGLAEEGVTSEMDQLIGENYYLRGLVYFQMVNVFGRPYSQGRENLGIPLKLTDDVSDTPDRNTVGEVYDQVLADLTRAESLMTVDKANNYATKEAAQALLSRVYLYMEENEKAVEYADKVINSGKYSLVSHDNLSKYFQLNPNDNPETIFCFKRLEDSDYNHGWYTVGSLYANINGAGWGEMYASSDYLDLLRMNPADQRFGFIEPQYLFDANGDKIPAVFWVDGDYKYQFRPITENGSSITFDQDGTTYDVLSEQEGDLTKYYFETGGEKQYVVKDYDMVKRNGYPKFYILKCSLQEEVSHLWSPLVSRLAEMYLNKAEAYAKSGNEAAAIENVNIIRERAGIETYESGNLPAGMTALDAALQERRMELAYEGHRKFDVFRNNRALNRRYPGTHLNGNNPYYEVTPTDNRVIVYIPEAQITAQPSLIQNP